MKKILSIFLSIAIMFTVSSTAFASYVYDDFIYYDEPMNIPYDITYNFFLCNQFKADKLTDIARLLDLIYRSKKTDVFIYPAQEIYQQAKLMLLEYIEKYADDCTKKGAITDRGSILDLDMYWKTAEHKSLPVLNNADEVYKATLECKNHPTYDKVYRINTDYLSYETYQASKLDTVISDVKNLYGEDISDYILNSTAFYDMSNLKVHYIIASIGEISDLEYDKEEDKNKKVERYYDILKNAVHIPITDDMSELDKIAILQSSVGNVIRRYENTNSPNSITTYSVGAGQCVHYADAFENLCTVYGIECKTVVGYSSVGYHAWNCLKYNGNWYMTDIQYIARSDIYDYTIENLPLVLYSSNSMKSQGYTWDEDSYPVCNSKNIVVYEEDIVYDLDFPETVKKYDLFEPYYIEIPLAGIRKVYCQAYFDKVEGRLYAIDTNLYIDKYIRDEEGNIISGSKERNLVIPSEIDGAKVKIIDSKLSRRKSGVDSTIKYGMGSSYDEIIIPDDVILEDFAFYGVESDMLIVGDNVSAGYQSLPTYGRSKDNVSVGENFFYKGDYIYSGQGNVFNKTYDYYNAYTGKEIVMYYSTKKDIRNDSNYPRVYFSGFGCNITDEEPVKTLTLCKETEYVDPRLNRLNRKFIIDGENPYYTAIDGVLYNKDLTKLISVPAGVKEIKIPDTVTEIGEYAFSYCHGLNYITIPKSVKKVGNRAFFHMSGLRNVYIEGDIPDGFKLNICGDASITVGSNTATNIIKWSIIGTELNLEYNGDKGRIFTVFYDKNGKIMSIKAGSKVQIPIYAKSFETYCWDKNLVPLADKISGEL